MDPFLKTGDLKKGIFLSKEIGVAAASGVRLLDDKKFAEAPSHSESFISSESSLTLLT
jgi:hypothetical protein